MSALQRQGASVPTGDEQRAALISSYLEAFVAANPESTPPTITYRGGWFRFGNRGVVTLYRRTQVEDMMGVLRSRAVSA
jgi:hypothetical protein